jgi:hypothetical protein
LIKRTILATVVLLAVVAALGVWFFRSSNTRLTVLPVSLPVVGDAVAHLKLPKKPRSIVIVIEENKSFEQIVNDPDEATYLHALGVRGAIFTNSHGVAHPSQPNYFALFSGQTDRNGDGCPPVGVAPTSANLGSELLAAHRTFRAYVEDLPAVGFSGCTSAHYVSRHAPWTHFTNVPASSWVPFSALRSYDALPDVAFVIPNLLHDMHSASIESGDAWLREHIDPLVRWADANESLVIITWDEDSSPRTNHIATFFVGPMVKPGRYDEPVTHYNMLRTIEDFEGTAHAGAAALASPILDCWK